MNELSPKAEANDTPLASKWGPRKAVPQALWGEEEQGNGVWDTRRVSHMEWTLRRRGGVLVSTGVPKQE